MSLNRPPSVMHYDRSGVINDGSEPQVLFERNPRRIGMMFQNQGTSPMTIVVKAARDGQGDSHWRVPVDAEWYYDQHGPINEVQILGVPGDKFAACEFGE